MKQKYIYICFFIIISFLLIYQIKVFSYEENKNILHETTVKIETNSDFKESIKNENNIKEENNKSEEIKEEIVTETIETEKQEKTIMVSVIKDNLKLELEEYIIGVLGCEMPALFEFEALKAGAIAARTYAIEKLSQNINYQFTGTVNDQCYQTKTELQFKWEDKFTDYYNKIKKAVNETNDLILTYKGNPIKAYYFSVSNGYTEDSKTVFNEELDYIEIVEAPLDKNTTAYERTVTMNISDFLTKLKLPMSERIEIKNLIRNKTNRVDKITINDKTFSGIEVRTLLGLRSTDFNIEEKSDQIVIRTLGYGHGVGMSQYGANELAKTGYKYEEILKYFYKNVEIKNIDA